MVSNHQYCTYIHLCSVIDICVYKIIIYHFQLLLNRIFACFVDIVQPHKNKSKAKSTLPAEAYQPNKELIVNTGESANLHCCVTGDKIRETAWYKQSVSRKPRIMAKWYKGLSNMDTFYNEYKTSRFLMKTNSTCHTMTIFNTSKSDEAMYYCGITEPELVFADGTFLSIKGNFMQHLLIH